MESDHVIPYCSSILYPNYQIFYLMEDFFQEGIGDSPTSLFVFFIFNQPQQL